MEEMDTEGLEKSCCSGNEGMNLGFPLEGNHKGWFMEVIPSFPARHQRVVLCKMKVGVFHFRLVCIDCKFFHGRSWMGPKESPKLVVCH